MSGMIDLPDLEFALRALENFNFESLTATVDYDADGDLTLRVNLQGSNPAIQYGRRIHFNLNVTDNVPALMRSLRLNDEFTKRVQRVLAK